MRLLLEEAMPWVSEYYELDSTPDSEIDSFGFGPFVGVHREDGGSSRLVQSDEWLAAVLHRGVPVAAVWIMGGDGDPYIRTARDAEFARHLLELRASDRLFLFDPAQAWLTERGDAVIPFDESAEALMPAPGTWKDYDRAVDKWVAARSVLGPLHGVWLVFCGGVLVAIAIIDVALYLRRSRTRPGT